MGAPRTRTGLFPAALREGLLQAFHGAAADDRRDAALALLASLFRAVGQEWAVEDDADISEQAFRVYRTITFFVRLPAEEVSLLAIRAQLRLRNIILPIYIRRRYLSNIVVK